uniref:Uncharacterized protein n=1 Tax=Tetradesmus obliquus TaxID=3088 RepID=A0A383WFZ8_TETOB|eukprot:jgi/Sobl393_1/18720/SZX75999.1
MQRLTLSNCCETQAGMLALNSLTAFSEINLRYYQVLADVPTSSAWAQLKQLRSLHIRSTIRPFGASDGVRGLQRVMAGVAAASGLCKLHLDFRDVDGVLRPKLFGYLTGLQQLQELRVKGVHAASIDGAHLQLYGANSECVRRAMSSDAADIMQLTALTGLTRLEVTSWTAGAAAAGALATGLPQLCRLKLYDCCIESTAALPALGRLSHLQHLDLRQNLRDVATACSC